MDITRPATSTVEALEADAQLGRDFNGSTLFSERVALLDEYGYTGSRRELMLRLLNVANEERQKFRAEKMEAERAGRKR